MGKKGPSINVGVKTYKALDELGFTPEAIRQNLKGFLQDSTEARNTLEISVNRQCTALFGEADISGNTKCYICGLPITSTAGNVPNGKQCEHVLVVLVIAMLCGLSHPDYQAIVDGWMAKSPPSIVNTFNKYRNKLLKDGTGTLSDSGGNYGTVYKWAHPACNLTKNVFPFLPIIFGPNGPKIDDTREGIDTIKYTLHSVHGGIQSYNVKWQTYMSNLGLVWPDADAINKRAEFVYNTFIYPIQKTITGNAPNLKKYCAISMNLMFKIIKGRINKKNNNTAHVQGTRKITDYFCNVWASLDNEARNYLMKELVDVRPDNLKTKVKNLGKKIGKKIIKTALKVVRPINGGGQTGGDPTVEQDVSLKEWLVQRTDLEIEGYFYDVLIDIGTLSGDMTNEELYIEISIFIDFSRFWADFIKNHILIYGN